MISNAQHEHTVGSNNWNSSNISIAQWELEAHNSP